MPPKKRKVTGQPRFFKKASYENHVVETFTFDNYFTASESWMDDPGPINPMAFLASFYHEYFLKNTVNYEKLKEDIGQGVHRAKELFKSLFRIHYSLRHEKSPVLDETTSFGHIVRHYGENIIAHGVEEMKGGMINLLLMCVSGDVKIKPQGWGRLVPGLPNMSPVSHGPYYVITSIDGDEPLSCPSISDVLYILVPFEKNIELMTEQLNQVEEKALISSAQKEEFQNKLISYEAFSILLDNRSGLGSDAVDASNLKI